MGLSLFFLIIFYTALSFYFQNLLREHGCLTQLSQLLRQQVQNLSNMSHNASAVEDDPEKSKMSEKFMNLLATAINNLSSNEQNHKQFEVHYLNYLICVTIHQNQTQLMIIIEQIHKFNSLRYNLELDRWGTLLSVLNIKSHFQKI